MTVRKKRALRKAAVLGAICLPILPAVAQEGGGVLYYLGISQDLSFADNAELNVPASGTSTFADTNLTFGILTEREGERLQFDTGISLTISDTPSTDGTYEFDLDQPFLNLSYDRETPNTLLGVDLFYDVSSVDRLNLGDFVNEEGALILPEDFDNLTGGGDRTDYRAAIAMEFGRTAPLGFVLSAGASGNSYSGTSDPDLFDFERTNIGGEALLRFSPTLTGIVGVSYDVYDADDVEQTYRTTTDGYVGVEYAFSSRATVSASVGVTQIETEEFGATTTDVTNPTWNLGAVYQMPNGELTADLSLSSDDDGAERRDILVGRSMSLPNGGLAFSLGLTDPEFGDVAPIGSLNWRRELPAGAISVNFNRYVASTNTDETQLATGLAVDYNQDINAVSALQLSLFYGITDGTPDAAGVTQGEVSATYSRALTEDWNLNTGIAYQIRDEDNVGRADSPSVFLSIGRRFDFRP